MKIVLPFASLIAFVVIILGAYTRLTNAGLGCPDWPGCYGKIMAPASIEEVQDFSPESFNPTKATTEMVHRYFAGTLGFFVLAFAIGSVVRKRNRLLSFGLLVLIIFQALLGMWTVTLKLHPFVVMSHLMGGFTVLGLLWVMVLMKAPVGALYITPLQTKPVNTRIVVIGFMILILQIFLGGWTSANYAALACPDFPTCQMQWFPKMNFYEAITLWREVGVNYEGGVLDNTARVTIHIMHRIGAIITFLLLGFISIYLTKKGKRLFRILGCLLGVLLMVQVVLGVSNVVFGLPLIIAVAHNGVAVLLLLTMITILYHSRFLPFK